MDNLGLHANNIRKNIVKMVANAKSGHPGGSLSAADIMTVLYFEEMNINEDNVDSIDRDRFVLSKGHASPCLYAALAERGLLHEDLLTFRKLNSNLQGHPNMNSVAGVDMSTGSLGQGISAAVGMAIANKLGKNDHRVYAMLGDGECEEGQVWEAAMAASHYHLDNLCAIVDFNGLQIDGNVQDVMDPTPIDKKFEAFGWNTINIDGHDFDDIRNAFKVARECKGKPTMILAHTIKGKGVSYMENAANWHGVAPNEEQLKIALEELEGK
ncbi:MAG: transketolase [Firmicutes bacterium]|nr:transketolase [Bacillota bacterium]MDD7227328.1 transketolase [Bacillota bacterium]MDY5998541.1 transketolase [Erysipelotrichaceae bacterium]